MDEKMKSEIDNMSQEEMAYLWRFAPPGSPYFKGEVGAYFKARFNSLGGFTPEISKKIGWQKNG